MQRRNIEITHKPEGGYRVGVDGVDVADSCSHLVLTLDGKTRTALVKLEHYAHASFIGIGHCVVGPNLTAYLISLGWRPPADTQR